MENASHIALARQMVIKREMDVVANNLANLSTNAYKAERSVFVEHLKRLDSGEQLSFVRDAALMRDLTEGRLNTTGNPFDLAISGDGYFEIETELGPRYTRNGSFQLNAEGELVTKSGLRVLDEGGGEIRVPGEDGPITVSEEGEISTLSGPVARLKVVRFADPQALKKLSGSLYDAGEQVPERSPDHRVRQGALEGSNVVGIIEMTRMMEALRSYSSAAKLVNDEHERQQKAIQVLGSRQAA